MENILRLKQNTSRDPKMRQVLYSYGMSWKQFELAFFLYNDERKLAVGHISALSLPSQVSLKLVLDCGENLDAP